MDLTAITEGAAQIAFDVAGDAKETATLHLKKSQSYDFDTDSSTQTGGADVQVEGVFYRERQAQGGQITTNNGVFMINGIDAPDGIDEADTLTLRGVIWQIDEVDLIPTKAVYLLRIRK